MALFKLAQSSKPHLTRCMSMLVNEPAYSWLGDIGIKEVNEGVYSGSWGGRGDIVTSISPINDKPIAKVIEGTVQDYEEVIGASKEASKQWAMVSYKMLG